MFKRIIAVEECDATESQFVFCRRAHNNNPLVIDPLQFVISDFAFFLLQLTSIKQE
jgi:hypothetical protein